MIFPPRDTHWNAETAHAYQQDVWDAAIRHVRNWSVAIDCGAHVGIFTRRMEERFAEVYAFEPLADNFRCLAQNTSKAFLFNCVLWNGVGKVAMRLTEHPNSGAAEVSGTMDGKYPAISLDAFCFRNVGLIKLDVQGSESVLLRGAKRTLMDGPVLIVENTGTDLLLEPVLEESKYVRVDKIRRDEIWVRE